MAFIRGLSSLNTFPTLYRAVMYLIVTTGSLMEQSVCWVKAVEVVRRTEFIKLTDTSASPNWYI